MNVPVASNKELVNMNQNEEVPDFLGGHGDLLPADVLKMVNELLEQLHRKDKDHQGGIVFNIYEKGSMHVDHVDTQNFYGDKWAKALQHHEPAACPSSAEPVFDQDTPLSALFREHHHEELRQTIEAWRPYLIGDDTSVDTLKIHSFHFDFSKVIAASIYIDLGRLLHAHALKDDNMSSLARYLFLHSNLSNSQATLYAQLRKYKKR